ncbi:MAG: hypothetical protein QOG68_2206, partial [Solirubrobacteraceae bacterium]|nr:hypothetical protein [Solirubrobacteraceae bacterium]
MSQPPDLPSSDLSQTAGPAIG